MPYIIKKLPSGQYAKVRKDNGKIVSRHATKEKAIASTVAESYNTGESMNRLLPGKR